jgi:hypothetical protein
MARHYDNNDYGLTLGLKKEEAYFLRFNYQTFRTWYNANGGYYPPDASWYPFPNNDEALALDRGELTFEGGIMFKDLPSLTFKYSHLTRDGEKSSTIWGATHPGLVGPTRGLVPSFYDIDEKRDVFELDSKYRIKATDLGLGVRYEMGDLNNALKTSQYPGEPLAGCRGTTVTDRQNVSRPVQRHFSETGLVPNCSSRPAF